MPHRCWCAAVCRWLIDVLRAECVACRRLPLVRAQQRCTCVRCFKRPVSTVCACKCDVCRQRTLLGCLSQTLLNHSAGADLSAQDRDGGTVLMFSVQHGHINLLRLLLSKRAKPTIKNAFGLTAVHFAAERGDMDALEELLTQGGNASALDCVGNSPIALACMHGHTAAVARLLKVGVDLNTGLVTSGRLSCGHETFPAGDAQQVIR